MFEKEMCQPQIPCVTEKLVIETPEVDLHEF